MYPSEEKGRKRGLASSGIPDEPATRRARRDILSSEIETLKAELEHERSLRSLDTKRWQKIQHRLERQVEFAVEEAKEAKSMMDELRDESDHHIQQLRDARAQAQAELREFQAQVEEERAVGAAVASEQDPRISRYESDLVARATENEALKETIEDLRTQLKQMRRDENQIPVADENPSLGASSAAPPAVLKEISRVRTQLAETERMNRQLQRLVDDLQTKAKSLAKEREGARSANTRVLHLEKALKELNKTHESTHAELKCWKDFGTVMGSLMKGANERDVDNSIPPETSVLKRYLSELKKTTDVHVNENRDLKQQLEKNDKTKKDLESSARESERKITILQKEVEDACKSTELLERQAKILQSQETIWKREIDSLRSIIKTFDQLPLAPASKPSQATSATIQALETSLAASREETKTLQEGQASLNKEVQSIVAEKSELQQTHNKVLEKFSKLREAVYEERAKAQKAEERACKAEELAGKGAFNVETTRVLHLQQSPMTEALKQEVNVLRRQLEVYTGGKQTSNTPTDVDPNKLHQRLKQSFKEQIGRFREGVYLLTGYKIDMIPDVNRPRFKVRSMFAELEDDHLMFKWPVGTDVQSLDLLDTHLAKNLLNTPSYEYIRRFQSLPAFLSSVQLTLFEKQTMM